MGTPVMDIAPVDLVPVAPQTKRIRASHLRWVKISDILPCPEAQREYDANWAARLASDFDLEAIGFIVVNIRNGYTYCIDGQHRIGALRLLGFGDDTVQCEVYEGLTVKEEAEEFLKRNNKKTVRQLDKFRVAVTADRQEETAIRRLMGAQGLTISQTGISAVGALTKAYRLQNAAGFSMMLRIIRDAYGEAGFRAHVINGLSLFLHRYDGQINEALAVTRLGGAAGGVNGLLGYAHKERNATLLPLAQCVAAAAVLIYNRGAGRQKLAPWWKE